MMSFDRTETLGRRRRALSKRTGGRPCLIAAGLPSARNFPANVYPFRASSHFLYLVGASISGAYLLLEDDRETLFVHRETASDILWHGPSASTEEHAAQTGCTVRYLDELQLADPQRVMTLPVMDSRTNTRLSALLGRTIEAGLIQDTDEPLAQAIVQGRLIHDELALSELRLAAAVTVEAHEAARTVIRPGGAGDEVWAAMQAVMTRHGMKPAYNPIVTTHGEVLHSDRVDWPLNAGDLLLIDVGAETPTGWAADVTRTWPVSGQLSASQAEMYTIVHRAHDQAIEAIRPGVSYRDIHLTACLALAEGLVDLGILRGDPHTLVGDDLHALFFPHGIGHLLGLDVHDMEDLGDRPGYPVGQKRSERFGLCYLRLNRVLEPGMVVTIEPGIYQVPALLDDPRWREKAGNRVDWDRLAMYGDVRGIRLENDVLVTRDGSSVLTGRLPM